MTHTPNDIHALIGRLHRDHYRDVLAPLIRITGSFALAEEVTQDSFAVALERWSVEGAPDDPLPWLRRVARNRAIDTLRRSARWRDKAAELAAESEAATYTDPDPERIEDDLLRLIFTCCHPALAPQARIALTLRHVCGLTSDEIARAFLVPRATLQQRLVRAKRKIDAAGIPYEVPSRPEMASRLVSVLQTIYVVFTEGYASTRDADLVREGLCEEAIRLARLLDELLPGRADVRALLALFLLHHARRDARVDEDGMIVRLDEQDRGRWDQDAIAEALPLVEECLRARPAPRYAVEAAIAALHDQAPSADETDWPQIAALYAELDRRGGGDPIIRLNRAVAVAMAGDLDAGLRGLDALDASNELESYHLLHVARAELLARAGDLKASIAALERARDLATSPVELAFIERRLIESAA